MTSSPFRCHVEFLSCLEEVVVIPLTSGDTDRRDPPRSVHLRGLDEVRRFIEFIGLDSIVTTRQLADLPVPKFEKTFHVLPHGEVIHSIEGRIRECEDAERCLFDDAELTSDFRRAFTPLDHLTLGASVLNATDGVDRFTVWIRERVRASV